MNSNFDDSLGAFVNFDADDQTPMSSSSDVKPVSALLHQSSSQFASNHQAFPDQTHQYDLWKQQTGLPMGGYANTLAVNQATGLSYRHGNGGFVVPNDILNVPLTTLGDDWDFSKPQSYNMDIESDSPTDAPSMFFADGQSNLSPAQQAPPRIYPGMHVEQQKIQQAQKQQEMIRQQQQQKQLAGQRPLPNTTPKTQVARDPHVEESISRLLNRMRQASTASADNDEDDSQDSGTSNMPRIKKDEEDMDDDERLLNSEEGKKLTSKERRQLRNKVSARAFRSRRKGQYLLFLLRWVVANIETEYITQLEAEVAVKNQEATDLRIQNRQLMEENNRLTDLTRMLLSSQSFSGFLQELSNSGLQQNNTNHQPAQHTTQTAQPQSQATRKDIPSHEAARQIQSHGNQMQVGMTFIPETNLDMSAFDGSTMWNSVLPSNDFQVFAVTELPEPPKIDFSHLSEKSNASKSVLREPSKQCTPCVPSHPVDLAEKGSAVTISTDVSAELYDQPSVTIPVPRELSLTLTKAAVASEILSASTSPSVPPGTSWSELQNSIAILDEICDKLSEMMPSR